ncbi:MAG: anaerobic sulfatase maturase [Candidatus Aminicenantes bacterium]|nr:anaerobic sulfatase maturase [Candidatus Aminicenantes bacterium]
MPQKQLTSVLVKPAGPDCNMVCTYCFYLKKSDLFSEVQKHRMSEDILQEMVKQVMEQAGREISFAWQGGEPTLMGLPFFKKAVELQERFGRGHVVGNGLQTNGVLIDEKWARFLREYDFLVGLSLDGPEHVHDKYRNLKSGRGSWSKVVDRAKLLLDSGVAVNALTVVNDYSVQFPDEIYAFHKSLGLNYMQFIPCVETDLRDSSKAAFFSVSSEKFGEFLCKIFDLWYADIHGTVANSSVRYFDSIFHQYVDLPVPDCTLLHECGVYVVVEHNGDVYSCDFFVEPEWKLGNIMEGTLTEMLNSERQNEFGRLKSAFPKECERCKWLRYCWGGCTKDRIRDLRDGGISHFCKATKVFFEYADARLRKLAAEWKNRQALGQFQQQVNSIYPQDTRQKVGRNDPCPCGSGKKFKHCCAKKK